MVRRSLFWGTGPYRGGTTGQTELRLHGVLRSSLRACSDGIILVVEMVAPPREGREEGVCIVSDAHETNHEGHACRGPGYASPEEAMKAEREKVLYTVALYVGTEV